jgi:hypothetical protein
MLLEARSKTKTLEISIKGNGLFFPISIKVDRDEFRAAGKAIEFIICGGLATIPNEFFNDDKGLDIPVSPGYPKIGILSIVYRKPLLEPRSYSTKIGLTFVRDKDVKATPMICLNYEFIRKLSVGNILGPIAAPKQRDEIVRPNLLCDIITHKVFIRDESKHGIAGVQHAVPEFFCETAWADKIWPVTINCPKCQPAQAPEYRVSRSVLYEEPSVGATDRIIGKPKNFSGKL